MAKVKWIKIVTDVFDDEKILMIESFPESDSIIVIWFKLLCLAGKQNNRGVFIMNNQFPYTDEMFSAIFRRPISTIRLALRTFEELGMIEMINNTVTIPNWGKHQSLDRIEKLNEYQKNYMRKVREEQKRLAEAEKEGSEEKEDGEKSICEPNKRTNCETNCETNVSSLLGVLDIDKDLDKDYNKILLSGTSELVPEPEPVKTKKTKSKVVVELMLNDKSMYPITEDHVKKWSGLYPGVDVMQQLRNMQGWIESNPTKRKTKGGIMRFITGWLAREQDRGGNFQMQKQQPKSKSLMPEMTPERVKAYEDLEVQFAEDLWPDIK